MDWLALGSIAGSSPVGSSIPLRGVDVAVGVAMGSSVLIKVGVAVLVGVNGLGVGVAVLVGVNGLGVGVAVLVGVNGLGVGVAVLVGVNGLGVGVAVLVGVNGLGVGVAVLVGVNGLGVGVAVFVGGAVVAVAVAVGGGLQIVEIALLSMVTAPVWAKALPNRLALVFSVILASASTLPMKAVFVPSVAALPTCQNTLQLDAPLIRSTEALLAVVRVLPV